MARGLDKSLKTILIAIAGVLLMSGCRPNIPPSCDMPDRGALNAAASNRLNPDELGRPLPTIVRIYQLGSLGTLEHATFEEMWQNDEETLGDALMAKDEFTIYPEAQVNRQFERNPEANFIVAMGIFRRPQGTSWRSVMILPPTASEQQCAANAEDPGSDPETPPMVKVDLFLDGYRIEGSLTMVPADSEECRPWDVACQAAEQAQAARDEAVSAAEPPAAPETPGTPSAPDTPTAADAAQKGEADSLPRRPQPDGIRGSVQVP